MCAWCHKVQNRASVTMELESQMTVSQYAAPGSAARVASALNH